MLEQDLSELFDLGNHQRKISTSSSQAQRLFNQGLKWCYCFNQEEGVKCFHKALQYDPACVMAHWGVAYGSGPFYNYSWCDFSEPQAYKVTSYCYEHIQLGKSFAEGATDLENQLLAALSQRFQKPHSVSLQEFNHWDDSYADAMRSVYQDYPLDHDVMALFAEALMCRTPWKLWDVTRGVPPDGADTYEALTVIEQSIALNKAAGSAQHPAILHLHIHCTEMSDTPERAMDSANRLIDQCPDAGHMQHMPGHIYVLCGNYEKARWVSEMSIDADDKYLDYAGPYNFYTTARCHDLHLMMYACMFLGQFQPAIDAANKMCETLSEEVLRHSDQPQLLHTMEGYYAMKMHVLVRFGRWRNIIDTPLPSDAALYCVSTAMHHYARGVACAALKDFDSAECQKDLFQQSVERIPANRKFFNNLAVETLGVGEKMLDGELEYHRGNVRSAFDHLREAVTRNDKLHYNEPWAWMHPPRHALAALLAEQGHYEEAEDIYRTDLGLNNKLQRCAQHPGNVWSLHGLVECLRVRDERTELSVYEKKLQVALSQSDGSVRSSCLCRS